MKQILMAVMVLVTGALFTGCDSESKAQPEKELLNGKSRKESDKNTICITCDLPFSGIPANEFMDVVARYKQTHYDVINNDAGVSSKMGAGFEDSRSVWFSLDTLKKFICYIEKYSGRVGISPNSLGIRFYYGVYPKNFSTHPERAGQHTLFMVPTFQFKGETADFDPYLSTSLNKKFFKEYLDGNSIQKLSILSSWIRDNSQLPIDTTSTSQQGFSWNNGKLCPTNCPTNYNSLTEVDSKYPAGLPY